VRNGIQTGKKSDSLTNKKMRDAMLGNVAHIGITVRDMEKAVAFYRDLLGFEVLGEVTIAGEEADRLTRIRGTVLRAVYVRSG
jgi:hypothetical protein